jgi:class 3 adenylate cyclase
LESQAFIFGRGQVDLHLKLSPLKDAAQETQGVALVVDDLTEQREREQMLDMMTRYLPPGMVDNIHQIAELALGGERREVTCMFIAACPYSAFGGLDAQATMELLNQYLQAATDAVHGTNGIIDKYMGNELMVLYNSQLNPLADHALCAVEAALEARRRFTELYRKLGAEPDPHQYQIGIHTGIATLGNVGSLNRRNFSAIGDSINLSKRLEENAASGQIIISEDTLHHIEAAHKRIPGHIRAVERGAVQVKGRRQMTRIYEVFHA